MKKIVCIITAALSALSLLALAGIKAKNYIRRAKHI